MEAALPADPGLDPGLDPDLVRPHWWSRFPSATEADYRAWNVGKMVPVVRGIAIPGTFHWLALPFYTAWWLGPDMRTSIWVVELAVLAPITALWAILTHPRLRRALVPFTIAGLPINGIALMYVCWTGFTDRIGPAGAVTAVVAAIWYAFIPLISRLGWRSTLLLGVLFNGLGAGMLLLDYADDQLTRSEVWVPMVFVASTPLVLGVASIAAEGSRRRSFVQEQVIVRQRSQLVESRQLIRRYAPTAVVSLIEQGDDTVSHAQRRRVTVFSSDVVGFTVLADQLDPEALAELINDYVGDLAELVERHGGTVTEFAGDGLMAIFGAPAETEPADQVRAATAAAFELQNTLPGWSERWYPLGLTAPLRARVGINTGVVSVGTFGTAVRATYTGIGIQMNVAARIQSHADPGGILLSSTSWHLIKDEVRCESRGEVQVKGVHYPIEMYAPAPAPPGG
ncbi:adenylate/guanylate cyclase domain-containing protein [Nocardioides stalactiti]|uniref:adenylate/guanylate cyclase domain-containing protein n=1 Tax=Nocardioides stalactiti TaxID=2755356 RepID=UPI001601CFE2|nr:adenylate/guanylate cyclase domain-containing protein [Nocardioides stalactiti]